MDIHIWYTQLLLNVRNRNLQKNLSCLHSPTTCAIFSLGFLIYLHIQRIKHCSIKMNQTAILIPDVNIQNIFPHLHIFTILIKLKIKFHPNTVDILEIQLFFSFQNNLCPIMDCLFITLVSVTTTKEDFSVKHINHHYCKCF